MISNNKIDIKTENSYESKNVLNKNMIKILKKLFTCCYYLFPLVICINLINKLMYFIEINGAQRLEKINNDGNRVNLYILTMCVSPFQYYISCTYPNIIKNISSKLNLSPVYFTHYSVLLFTLLKPMAYFNMIKFNYNDFIEYYHSIYPFMNNKFILYSDIILLCYLAFGQYLNYSIYKNIGITGVNYGVYFGHKIPWSYDFPFNLNTKHPQYLGAIYTLCVLNIMITPIRKIKYLLYSFWVIFITYYINIKVEK